MRHSYRASSWRARAALPLALGAVAAILLLLVAGAVRLARAVVASGTADAGLLCGWGLLLGVGGFLLWQATLAACNALVCTADLELSEGVLVVWLAGRWPVRAEWGHIFPGRAAEVIYRLGRPVRLPGVIIRPRRRFPAALFIPVRQARGWVFPLWAVARMYGGRGDRLGFLVTPDHEQHQGLVDELRQSA